jgi:thymidylate synthase
MIQEMAACELNLELGFYHHYAASLHLYETHFDLAKRVVNALPVSYEAMNPMTAVDELPAVLEAEKRLRKGTDSDFAGVSSRYWREILSVLESFARRKTGTNPSSALEPPAAVGDEQ